MENSLSKLAETGLLGVLLVITLVTIGFLYKEAKSEREARLKDLQEYTKTDRVFINEIKQTLDNILSLLRIKQ
jgi:hypothetical protein